MYNPLILLDFHGPNRPISLLSSWHSWLRQLHFLLHVCVCPTASVVSDSLRPHGLARPLCPWDSPGNSTGVGCMLSSRRSSRPSNPTHVSCTAGRTFTTKPPGRPIFPPHIYFQFRHQSFNSLHWMEKPPTRLISTLSILAHTEWSWRNRYTQTHTHTTSAFWTQFILIITIVF